MGTFEMRRVKRELMAKALGLLCKATDVELEYDEQVYEPLKNVLRHAARVSESKVLSLPPRLLWDSLQP